IPILLYYPYAFIVFKINLYFNYKLPKGITHEIKIDLANDSPVVNDVFNYDFPGNYSLVGKSEDDISIIPDNLNYTNDVPYIPSKVLKFRYSLNGEIIVAERLSPENDTIDYWILDSTIPIVYGEMSKEEYEEKLKEYSATEEFELMDVAPFKETYVYP
ncbi:DUF3997 domain-containing protein, partial [Patescibacteria group bacterium]|nr:DUF3997 domain-containing protein [Patescibacteria group bacterium]